MLFYSGCFLRCVVKVHFKGIRGKGKLTNTAGYKSFVFSDLHRLTNGLAVCLAIGIGAG
jgi:hypothetical protein